MPNKTLCILRLLLTVGPSSAPYNQFSLPVSDRQHITICSYFKTYTPIPKSITLFEGNGTLRGCFQALRAALDSQRYDVVHIHMPHIGLPFLITDLSRRRKLLNRAVYTVHTSYPNLRLKHKLMLIPIFALVRKVVFCSRASLASFPGFLRWFAGDRVTVVQNGVDIERIDQALERSRQSPKDGGFKVVTVGRLIELKDPMSILRAFQLSDDGSGKLVFIGEGALRPQLISASKELGLANRVEVMGLISRDRVYEYLAGADLFVSASVVEGLPVSVLEAMACRCPVVLSDILPHQEIVRDVALPLVPVRDVMGFAREIERFRQMTPDGRKTVGERCRKLVEERFSLPVMLNRYEDIYTQIQDVD